MEGIYHMSIKDLKIEKLE